MSAPGQTFELQEAANFGPQGKMLFAGTTGIIAIGASKPTVTADAAGRIGVERQMAVNLTCDHRLVYGTDAAEFMKTLKSVLENPDQLTF